MKRSSLLLLFLALSPFLAAQNPKMLMDIRSGSAESIGGIMSVSSAIFNGALYFVADDGIHGRELWKTDGTSSGTSLVRDFWSGSQSGITGPGYAYVYSCNGSLYMGADDGTTGYEPYRTSDPADPFMLVKNIFPDGKKGTESSSPRYFTECGGMTWFSAAISKKKVKDPYLNGNVFITAYRYELHRSDGTTAGTTMVKSLAPANYDGTNPRRVSAWGNVLYYVANVDGYGGNRLCRSDGTDAGTYLVSSAVTMRTDPYFWGYNFPVVNNALYFVGTDDANGYELWRTDGTANGTIMFKDINPNGDSFPLFFTEFNGKVYFTADDGVNGRELWVSDLTANGTVMLKDILTGGGSSSPSWLTVFNGALYFMAAGEDGRRQLWISDGTANGTQKLLTINHYGDCEPLYTGYGGGYYDYLHFPIVGDRFYFYADDGTHGIELWSCDGTAVGTAMVKDANPGGGGLEIRSLVAVDGKIVYTAVLPAYGREPWAYDPAQPVSKGTAAAAAPSAWALHQNHPNPFGERTLITVNAPEDAYMILRIYDALGRELATLADGWTTAGSRSFSWDASAFPPGMYICRLDAAGRIITRTMLLGR